MARILLFAAAVAAAIFWVAMIVDAVTNRGVSDT
jgi:hypothetical protein